MSLMTTRITDEIKSQQTVLVRLEANSNIGHGHLARCLSITRKLIDRFDVVFLMRECNELIEKKVYQSGAKICYLATSKKVEFKSSNYNTWLGALINDDAEEVVGDIVDNSLDKPHIITDCYGIDTDWLGICRPYCSTVMCVDDLMNRFLDCDILVDPTFKRGELEYRNLVPDRTILLCGSQYMPLPESLANGLEKPLKKQDGVNILVSFGATDPNDFSIKLMRYLKTEDLPVNHSFKILLTSDYKKSTELFNLVRNLQANNRPVQVTIDTKDIAMEYAWADICIGAAGQSIYERIFSKLHSINDWVPFILVSINDCDSIILLSTWVSAAK